MRDEETVVVFGPPFPESVPGAGTWPPLTVPCPIDHKDRLGIPVPYVEAELPDRTKVRRTCARCNGRGVILTDFGEHVLYVVGLFKESE